MDSLQIQDALIRLGFQVTKDNVRIIGIGHPARDGEVLYLKTRREGRDAPAVPMERQPLVIPREYASFESFRQSRAAATPFNAEYKNSNMTSFSTLDGQFAGLAVNVPDLSALLEIIALLGLPRSGTAQEDIAAATDLPESTTDRQQVIAARLGQGLFRTRLFERWSCCAVTECQNLRLLRASHIKPWRESNNEERLSVENGLLLQAGLDAAFDSGLISFQDDGRMVISPLLSTEDMVAVGIRKGMKLRKVSAGTVAFLRFHRAQHGFRT